MKAERILSSWRDALRVTHSCMQTQAHPQGVVKSVVVESRVRAWRGEQEVRGVCRARGGDAEPRGGIGGPIGRDAIGGGELGRKGAGPCGFQKGEEPDRIEAVRPIVLGGGEHRPGS